MSTTAKLVRIRDWAKIVFGEKPPHPNTLHRWTHDGRIFPQPKKVGRNWYVNPNAEYRGD